MQIFFLVLTAVLLVLGWIKSRSKTNAQNLRLTVSSLWIGLILFAANLGFTLVFAALLTVDYSQELMDSGQLISQILGVISSSLLVASSVGFILFTRKSQKEFLRKSRMFLYTGFGLLGLVQPLTFNRVLFLVVLSVSLVLIWLSLSALIAEMAESKNRSWAAFFWLSVLVSPLLMWIIAATISPASNPSLPPEKPSNIGVNNNQDFAEKLKKLSELRDEGILTKAEFEAKKKELLDRI